MHLGLGGVILAIWFVAILFGDADTRDAAWAFAVAVLALAVGAALLLGLFLLSRHR